MEVLKKEEKILSKEEAAEFYKQHEGSEHFDQLVEFMSRYSTKLNLNSSLGLSYTCHRNLFAFQL